MFGAKEPGTFVQDSQSLQRLTEAKVDWMLLDEMDEEIMRVAKSGHPTDESKQSEQTSQGQLPTEVQSKQTGTNVDDISAEERKRQESMPRNPKKRMMEVDVPP
jgi:nicotinate-nucleotide pyrophosphorylase